MRARVDRRMGIVRGTGIVLTGALLVALAGTASAETFGEAGSWGGAVRTGPEAGAASVATLAEGDPVRLLERTEVIWRGFPWFRVALASEVEGYQWGGILCSFAAPIEGTFGVCIEDNRAAARAAALEATEGEAGERGAGERAATEATLGAPRPVRRPRR